MKKQLYVLQDILGTNQKIAQEIKSSCEEKGVLVLNLMSSPGAGKTTLLEKLAERLKDATGWPSSKATSKPSATPSASGPRACRPGRSPPAAPAIWRPR